MRRYVFVWLSLAAAVAVIALGANHFLTPELKRNRSVIEPKEEGKGSADEEFYRQRAYPLNTIPIGARQKAIEQAENEERRLRNSSRFASELARLEADSDLGWTQLGPQPIKAVPGDPSGSYAGRITAIALHPQYDGISNQTVYVGGALGGLWRSTNNGQSWTPLTDDLPSQAVGSIAIDPTNPNIILVGSGEGNRSGDSYYGGGLYKTTDGGATWRVIGGPNSTIAPTKPVFINAAITRIAIDPVTPNVVFVTTTLGGTASASGSAGSVEASKQKGVWKSTDGGETWRNVDPDGSAGVQSAHAVIIDPLNHNIVYAAVRTRGIYRSKTGGEPGTWEKLTNGVANTDNTGQAFLRCSIAAGPAIAPSTAATLYASFERTSDSTIFGFYQSKDGGDSWTQMATPPTETPGSAQAGYNMFIAVDPTDGNTVYYGGQYNYRRSANALVRSTDGGSTWTDMNSNSLHPDTHAIAIASRNRNILFTGNDGGVWRTDGATAGSISWTTLNPGLNLTQFQSVAMHPTDPNILIGGTQDNGTNKHSGATGWDNLDDGDGGFTLIDQSNPNVMYHTYYNGSQYFSPSLSLNGGQRGSWQFIGCDECVANQGGLNPNDRVKFYAPLALNPAFTGSNGNVVYFGTHRLYRTANRGTTWTGLGSSSDGFGQDLTLGSGRITTIAAHPKVDNNTSPATEIVWVGTDDGQVQVTSNAGSLAAATFTNTTKAPLPNRFVSDIAADSNDPNRAVVVYSGFDVNTQSTPGHVFLTTNRGSSWTNISGNLPDVPVTSVALDPNSTNRLWIGTDIGVFETTDGGATWLRLSKGMPQVAVFMLRYHNATGNLIAATHGRGMYRWRTYTTGATVSAASYAANAEVARDSIVSVFGVSLATGTAPAPPGVFPLPTALTGTTLLVRDSQGVERPASLFFAGPGQINAHIPAGTADGTATITIRNSLGETSSGTVRIGAVAPGLFTGDANGSGAAAGFAIRVRGAAQTREGLFAIDTATNRAVTRAIDFDPATESLFFELYGTGVRNRSSQANVSCEIGGVTIPVEYASLAPGFIGLDQINIRVPNSLDNRGEVDLVIIVDGKRSQAVRVNIR
ncbi:MAG TPA: hypothetical protein VFZ34_00685 [Blastocatellia bacterium]|nr:hypothetical protein [Blastocatellia bacterium]